jgi:hypothetical protein
VLRKVVRPPEFPEVLDGLADLCVDVGNRLPHFEAEGGCAGRLQQLHRRDDAEVIVESDGALIDDAFGSHQQRGECVVRHLGDGVDSLGDYPLELLHHPLPAATMVRRVLNVEDKFDAPPLLCFFGKLALETSFCKSFR